MVATDLSSDSPHLQSTGGQDGQLGDGLRLEPLQSEDGGDRETASHYHVGGWGREGISTVCWSCDSHVIVM